MTVEHEAPPAPRPASEGLAERLRLGLAVPVAFLSSLLGVLCVVCLPDVVTTIANLSLLDTRFVGWAGVASAVTVGTGATALLVVTRIGPGPALSLGAAAAVFGIALSREVIESFQLTLALLLLGAAVGCLLGGSASMTFELPDRLRRRAMAAWAVPVVSAWPLLAWLSQHVDPLTGDTAPRLTYHPSVWILAPASALIVLWSAVTMLIEPQRASVRSGPVWETAWTALLGTGLASALATMAIGFDPNLPHGWLRPIVLFVSGAIVATLAVLTLLLPIGWARIGYLLLVFVLVMFPTTVQLLVIVADGGDSRVPWWLAALMVLVTVLGSWLGAVRPRWVWLSLLVVAAACAGAWVMPDSPAWMAASGLPLCLATGAVFGTGVRHLAATAVGWRHGALAVVVVASLGTVTGVAVSWALGGDIPSDVDAARAAGRVFLGFSFAFAVMTAAVVSVLAPRGDRELREEGQSAGSDIDILPAIRG
jgi:hypothetical protein